MERKLASVRRIIDKKNIDGADLIEAYKVDGWWVVGKKDEFQLNDLVCYFEIDSWIPNDIAAFLSKGKEPREFNGIKGERLRTIKLKGQISQGLILPLNDVLMPKSRIPDLQEGDDLTCELKIQKWEPPVHPQMAGQIKGNFPSFIRKTDQERVQNLTYEFDRWQQDDLMFEITEKLDGSSMTVYFYNGEFGVCSRNLDLKFDENNAFWKTALKYNLPDKLMALGANVAIQGELVGPGIQGNLYKLTDHEFYVFDVWNIDNQVYYDPEARLGLSLFLGLDHCPIIYASSRLDMFVDIDDVLFHAENKSILHDVHREGVVFKCLSDSSISFKAISNKYLLSLK